MDERERQIYEVGESLLSERLKDNIAKIELAFETMQDSDETGFYKAFEEMLGQVQIAQEKTEKEILRYIYISFLQSSIYTKSYAFRIDAYDKRQFADITDTHVYWSPQFIFEYFDEDMAYFRKYISSKVLRVREYEIMQFATRYASHYFQMVQALVSVLIAPLIEDVEEITVLFGGYLDQVFVIADKKGQ